MPATAASAHAPVAPSAPFLSTRPVWQVSYLAGLCRQRRRRDLGAGRARRGRADDSSPALARTTRRGVTVGMFAMGTMVVTFWFTFAVILMARLLEEPPAHLPSVRRCRCSPSRSPCRITAADTATSTKLTLAAAHLIAGAIIVPVVARRLSRPR